MTDRNVTLSLDVVSDASVSAREVNAAAAAYDDLARSVAQVDDVASRSSRSLDGISDGADELAGTSSAATGALGALGSGFELLGPAGEKYGAMLGQASLATDFLSGVGDSLTLVLKNSRVATIAATAATKVQTVAQRGLNLVMRANPIGLIVTGVLLLIGGLILLYKRSERFREIVKNVGEVGKKAIDGIVKVTAGLVDWVKDKVPDAFNTAKGLVVRYIGFITTPYRKIFDIGKDIAGFVKNDIPEGFRTAKDKAVPIIEAILSPFVNIYNTVQDIIEAIGNIDLGVIGDIAGGLFRGQGGKGYAIYGASGPGRGAPTPAPSVVEVQAGNQTFNYFTIQGAIDPTSTARQIVELLTRYGYNVGAFNTGAAQ